MSMVGIIYACAGLNYYFFPLCLKNLNTWNSFYNPMLISFYVLVGCFLVICWWLAIELKIHYTWTRYVLMFVLVELLVYTTRPVYLKSVNPSFSVTKSITKHSNQLNIYSFNKPIYVIQWLSWMLEWFNGVSSYEFWVIGSPIEE